MQAEDVDIVQGQRNGRLRKRRVGDVGELENLKGRAVAVSEQGVSTVDGIIPKRMQ
jgi:hypothetical protein